MQRGNIPHSTEADHFPSTFQAKLLDLAQKPTYATVIRHPQNLSYPQPAAALGPRRHSAFEARSLPKNETEDHIASIRTLRKARRGCNTSEKTRVWA
jgi:hypothetical protein